MKPLSAPLFALFVTFFFVQCSDPTGKNPVVDDDLVEEPVDSSSSACDTIQDFQVFGVTADLWINAWNDLIFQVGDSAALRAMDGLERGRYFPIDNVRSAAETGTHVRFYFARMDVAEIGTQWAPDLIMVPVSECTDNLETIYISAYSSEVDTVVLDSAKKYITNWNTTRPQNEPMLNVRAYTYTSSAILDYLENLNSEMGGVPVGFAIHTKDALARDPKNKSKFSATQGYLVTDLVLEGATPNDAMYYVDFATPCPELCDSTSALFQASLESN